MPRATQEPAPLWERQEGESPKAFAAFCAFRDLPPERRTVPAAFQALKGRPSGGHGGASQWRLWRSKNAWDARVDAWDREQDRVAQAEFQRARKQALREQAAAYRFALTRGIEAIRGLQASGGVESVGASAAVRLLEVGAAGLGRVYGTVPDTTVEVAAAPAGAGREASRLRIEALLQQLAPLPDGMEEPPDGAR